MSENRHQTKSSVEVAPADALQGEASPTLDPQTPAPNANEPIVGDILESALPTATAAEVAHLRALNAQGESVNLASKQITELVLNDENKAKVTELVLNDENKAKVTELVLNDENKAKVQKLAGLDYSLLEEQEVPGEYFLDINGVRKQVYARTFRFSQPVILLPAENRGLWGIQYAIPNISGILSTTGTMAYGSVVCAIIPFKDFLFYAEIINGQIFFGGRLEKEYVGKEIIINVVLKYTK